MSIARPIAMLSGAEVGTDAPAGSIVLVAPREDDGRVAIIAPALHDERLIAGAIAKAVPERASARPAPRAPRP
jgi:hypothetical protein